MRSRCIRTMAGTRTTGADAAPATAGWLGGGIDGGLQSKQPTNGEELRRVKALCPAVLEDDRTRQPIEASQGTGQARVRAVAAVRELLGIAAAITWVLCALHGRLAGAQDSGLRFGGQIPADVDLIYERGLAWLAAQQGESGRWNDQHQGCGVDGICLMAFLAGGDDPNFGRHAGTVRRAIRSIIMEQDPNTGYFPNSMYHHGFAMLALAEAYGVVDESMLWDAAAAGAKKRSIAQALDLAVRCAATAQKKNRLGGWRYSPDATDADTSVTGAVLMGLLAARNAGMDVADETVNAALDYMARSTGRDGSVAYSGGIGGGGGSINLSAIGTLVNAVGRRRDSDAFKWALRRISASLESGENHGYIEYYRYYMAQALFQGDYEAWQKWNGATARQLKDTQSTDGSFNNSAYSTGMSLLALALNYRFLPIYER